MLKKNPGSIENSGMYSSILQGHGGEALPDKLEAAFCYAALYEFN